MDAELFAGDAFPRYTRPEWTGLVAYRPPQPRRGAHRRYRPAHACQRSTNRVVWRAAALLPAVIAVLALLAVAAPVLGSGETQQAAASTVPMRVRALEWAETKAGDWYSYGSAGPSTFDCSGLVMEAWLRGAGLQLPRTTYGMAADLSQLRVIPVADARRGDLLFFGTGHVELKTRAANGSFGALEPGTRIGWHRWTRYWHPTFAMALG